MFMGAILIVILVVIIIIIVAISQSNSAGTNNTIPASQRKSQKIVDEINRNRETPAQREIRLDAIYAKNYTFHKNKTIDEIQDYIEYRRTSDDDYWGRNRIEYRALMVLIRENQTGVPEPPYKSYAGKTKYFKDQTIVITGTFENWTERSELVSLLESLGATVHANITENTQILITGNNAEPEVVNMMNKNIASGSYARILEEKTVINIIKVLR
jgi:NAD-dependent DNA ligase